MPIEQPVSTADVSEVGPAPPRRGWLREPLLHFMLIGIALFLVYYALNRGHPDAPRTIEVTQARIEALAENFSRTWMRSPTDRELQGLVDDYVAEEVYYREAIAIGLDRDDTVIRRRLRQKMEFVTDDMASSLAATDAQLQSYLDSHKATFVLPGHVTFEQVFLSADKRGDAVHGDAERLLARLRSGTLTGPTQALGDPTMLPAAMEAATPQLIDNTFGAEFTASVVKATPGQWIGPVTSGYGVHLVRVERVEAGAVPSLAQVRPAVEREWQAEQRRRAKAALLRQLLAKYDVHIESSSSVLSPPASRVTAAGAAR